MRKKYNINMKTLDIICGVILAVAVFTIFALGLITGTKFQDQKFDECIGLANKYIPDPNDTEERSKFIKECYETPNEKSEIED